MEYPLKIRLRADLRGQRDDILVISSTHELTVVTMEDHLTPLSVELVPDPVTKTEPKTKPFLRTKPSRRAVPRNREYDLLKQLRNGRPATIEKIARGMAVTRAGASWWTRQGNKTGLTRSVRRGVYEITQLGLERLTYHELKPEAQTTPSNGQSSDPHDNAQFTMFQ